jgi:uncharacterized protein (TIGR02679 family)
VIGKALFELEHSSTPQYLSVFASSITASPHGFDRNKTLGELLMHGICFWKGFSFPKSALSWQEYLKTAGIISDNIASFVHAYGLQIETKEGIHPAFAAFNERKEPFVISGENIQNMTSAYAVRDRVYVVENEMVFLHLLSELKEVDVTILCTSGQLRVSAFHILNALIERGTTIYYAGDLDGDGIEIANRLWNTYPDHVQIWRMDEEDYILCKSSDTLSKTQLAKLNNITHPNLKKTANLVALWQKAGYQEELIAQMKKDIVA